MMDKKIIYKFIKTPCGQMKYEQLSLNKSLFGQLRLYWFIFFAALRDLTIKS